MKYSLKYDLGFIVGFAGQIVLREGESIKRQSFLARKFWRENVLGAPNRYAATWRPRPPAILKLRQDCPTPSTLLHLIRHSRHWTTVADDIDSPNETAAASCTCRVAAART